MRKEFVIGLLIISMLILSSCGGGGTQRGFGRFGGGGGQQQGGDFLTGTRGLDMKWCLWCKNGCGKSIIYKPTPLKKSKPYFCLRCGGRFTKKQVEKMNKR